MNDWRSQAGMRPEVALTGKLAQANGGVGAVLLFSMPSPTLTASTMLLDPPEMHT